MSSRILIIGGGLGGLSLAQGLRKAGISFHVFERIPAADFQAQGYRIRVNENGAASLQQVLSPELWELFDRTCAVNVPGVTFFHASDGQAKTPSFKMPTVLKQTKSHNVDRTVLRDVLLTGLGPNLTFGKELSKYTLESASVTAHFTDGTSEEGCLLVGAEGIRSPTRLQHLPDHKPIDTDLRCLYGKTPLTPQLLEQMPLQMTKGMTVTRDETPTSLFLEVMRFPTTDWPGSFRPPPADYVYWVLGSRAKTFGVTDKELLSSSKENLVELSLSLTASWAPSIRTIFEHQDPSQTSLLRIASALPDMRPWHPSDQVTLLGDAVHVMPPTGGIGANTAFRDAASLCTAIMDEGVSEQSIGRYEETMREYAREAIEGSAHGGKIHMNQPPFEQCEPLKF